jgi:hypothetical protein
MKRDNLFAELKRRSVYNVASTCNRQGLTCIRQACATICAGNQSCTHGMDDDDLI